MKTELEFIRALEIEFGYQGLMDTNNLRFMCKKRKKKLKDKQE